MKMKRSYLASLLIFLGLISSCMGCSTIAEKTGVITKSFDSYYSFNNCWILKVPEGTYGKLDFKQSTNYRTRPCSSYYMSVTETKTNKEQKFCFPEGKSSDSLTILSDVKIQLYNDGDGKNQHNTQLSLNYHIEDLVCTEDNKFRCSWNSCVRQSQVCDGVKDCPNGNDELSCVTAVQGVSASLYNATTWLMDQRTSSYSWDKNTNRAVTALSLGGEFLFYGQDLEEELVAKQLELEVALALLRNSTDPLSVGDLSMFVEALAVTCHNPRGFYGEDLLKILAERVYAQESPSPRAYLTLCNLNWTLTKSDVGKLVTLLKKQSAYPFLLDVQAVTLMALACTKNRIKEFRSIANAQHTFNATVDRFVARQQPDGSFGNVYTTALVTQALVASNKLQAVEGWDVGATMLYLKDQLSSSTVDFLSAYLTIPIFSGKSLTDLQAINCDNSTRKQIRDDIADITTKIGIRKRIQYSLYVGDKKDVIHTMYVRMPENSSAHDVMRVAQALDSKYKFIQKDVSGHMYVYEIAGITNDPETGKFWLLYTGDNNIDGEVEHHLESPDRFYLGDSEHLILWYKTVDM